MLSTGHPCLGVSCVLLSVQQLQKTDAVQLAHSAGHHTPDSRGYTAEMRDRRRIGELVGDFLLRDDHGWILASQRNGGMSRTSDGLERIF